MNAIVTAARAGIAAQALADAVGAHLAAPPDWPNIALRTALAAYRVATGAKP